MRVPVKITPAVERSPEGRAFQRASSNMDLQSGAALGNGLAQLGNTLGTVGGLLTEQAKQAKRMGTLQSFSMFQAQVDERLNNLKREAHPAQGNFADQAAAIYNNMETDWLKNVPDEFYDEFKTRATDLRATVARNALAFQYESTDNYFRQGIADAANQAAMSLDQDGSLANLDRQRAMIDEYINSTTLTEAEKVAKRRAAYAAIEAVSYKSEVRKGNLEIGALGVGSGPGTAADLILEWDGAALENGLPYEENVQLVNARVEEAQGVLLSSLTSIEQWEAMPEYTKAALISLVDDLGELPESVKQAIDTGDLVELAAAIEALGGERRAAEADIAQGLALLPEGQLDADPRFANIPYEDRLALRADAEREAAALATAQAKAEAAQKEAAINDLFLRLFDGQAGQFEIDQARETGVLSDYAKVAQAHKILEDRNSGLVLLQQAQMKLAQGIEFNPDSTDDKKMLNAVVGADGLAALQSGDGQFVTNVLVPLVRTSKDIPTDTAGTLEGMMRSDDPRKALFALDTLAQLQQASPFAYDSRLPEAVRADVEYWQTVKDYYSPEKVMEGIREGYTQEQRVRTKMLREEAKTLLDDGKVDSVTSVERYVQNLIPTMGDRAESGGWRWGDPVMEAGSKLAMTADFNRLFEYEYGRDGNEQRALDAATERLASIWRVTNVGGRQTLMRYPPELMGYESWDGSHEWINQQARSELGLPDGAPFALVSDEQTVAEFHAWQKSPDAAPRPSYQIFAYDDRGQLATPTVKEEGPDGEIIDTGIPQRIFFQVTPEMEAEKAARFEARKQEQDYQQFMNLYNEAKRHSLRTGVAIPAELQQEYDDWVALRGHSWR